MTNIRSLAIRTLSRYLEKFPEEAPALAALRGQLLADIGDVFSRTNMRGHVTTSALVVDDVQQKVLLIHHKAYDRWLQPGGYYEEGSASQPDSLWLSAAREVAEETGLLEVCLHSWSTALQVPIDIDTHPIAANPKKGEGEHCHHDFLYLATADSSQPLTAQLEEVKGAKWVPLADLASLGSRLARVHRKLVGLGIAKG